MSYTKPIKIVNGVPKEQKPASDGIEACKIKVGSQELNGTSVSELLGLPARVDDLELAVSQINTTLSSSTVESDSVTTTNSSTDSLLSGMTITPNQGTYLVNFSTTVTHNSGGSSVSASIYAGNSKVSASTRTVVPNISSNAYTIMLSTHAIVTVDGTQSIESRWSTSSGMATAGSRSMSIIRIG